MASTMGGLPGRTFTWFSRICRDPSDNADDHSEKMVMAMGGVIIVPVTGLLGLLYYSVGQPWAASVLFFCAFASAANVLFLTQTQNHALFRFVQLSLMLVMPYLLMLVLGGFINSSAIVLWSLLAPFGALFSSRSVRSFGWLVAYLLLLASAIFLQPRVRVANPMSSNTIFLFFLINIGIVSFASFMMSYHFVEQVKLFQKKSDDLLLNILPKDVVEILKDHSQTIANHYESASILFADMVNFTPLSASMSPPAVVDLLNQIFSRFDSLVEEHGLEKIKTMGDCYMVASGVPRQRQDHAQAIIRLALDMSRCLDQQNFGTREPVTFRIGVNSGPVMAGVIGHKKFIYDLWGDAVNTASRMQSHGTAGRIQISHATYDLVKQDFACEHGGAVNVKGKGEMEVWFITGHRISIFGETPRHRQAF
jgi:adenylate cyclase